MDRKTILFQGIDVSKSVGLEIGPACYPTVNKDEGEIYYLDYLSRDDLLSKYKADSSMRLSDMVEVDFVCPDGRISECVGSML